MNSSLLAIVNAFEKYNDSDDSNITLPKLHWLIGSQSDDITNLAIVKLKEFGVTFDKIHNVGKCAIVEITDQNSHALLKGHSKNLLTHFRNGWISDRKEPNWVDQYASVRELFGLKIEEMFATRSTPDDKAFIKHVAEEKAERFSSTEREDTLKVIELSYKQAEMLTLSNVLESLSQSLTHMLGCDVSEKLYSLKPWIIARLQNKIIMERFSTYEMIARYDVLDDVMALTNPELWIDETINQNKLPSYTTDEILEDTYEDFKDMFSEVFMHCEIVNDFETSNTTHFKQLDSDGNLDFTLSKPELKFSYLYTSCYMKSLASAIWRHIVFFVSTKQKATINAAVMAQVNQFAPLDVSFEGFEVNMSDVVAAALK
ncbi:hypothetical protein [Vibrio alginolyticus]|uniref:hypothetical protein n=1 Tax=Vibrio alginolyticus TaxID=663 RepID=UPI0006CA7452|nr:hypothetical protein [Vibrio alginolyticus]KPM97580.1 hypothetical protein AOG25_14010 [Vibrio alginolyticus]CAH7367308.1 conserved hypothetical protein [Vibrio chagasii]